MIHSHLTRLIHNEIDPLFTYYVASDGRIYEHYDQSEAHETLNEAGGSL